MNKKLHIVKRVLCDRQRERERDVIESERAAVGEMLIYLGEVKRGLVMVVTCELRSER